MSSNPVMAEHSSDGPDAQRIVRVKGSRRVRLTPVPGSDPNPESAAAAVAERQAAASSPGVKKTQPRGPNDERMMLDVPPHY